MRGKNKLPTDHLAFERMIQHFGLRPVKKLVTNHGDILIAEGGPYLMPDKNPDGSNRYAYQAAYCVTRGVNDLARWLEFDINHDFNLTEEGRREARINAAVSDAMGFIEANVKAGRYS